MQRKNEMRVKKRNNELEVFSFDKILNRIQLLTPSLETINSYTLTMKVIGQLYDEIETTKIDELTAEQCESLSSMHPDYSILAARIIISNNHKKTTTVFSDAMRKLYYSAPSPLLCAKFSHFVSSFGDELDKMVDCSRDYLIDYFGYKTLERAYLFSIDNKIVERPQYMWMRVAIGIHYQRWPNTFYATILHDIKETYDLLSNKYYTHATPTLFNAGTPRPQLSSCFLLTMKDDSIEGIFSTLQDCAIISKHAGGIGLPVHNIRAKGSRIHGTNGSSNGIVPMLRVFNNTAKYVDQGGNKRKGSFAIYLEPWHADIEDFLEMKKNHGDEESKGRDLFYALWVPDLFMERVDSNGTWSLFCPNIAHGLADVYGEAFNTLYLQYERENKAIKEISARSLWLKILDAQMETGTPYLLFKDAINAKSNQKNLGTIRSSNLCCEIMEYSDPEETAVCNLASIALPTFVNKETKEFDYARLHAITKIVTKNLNYVIDVNFYPIPSTEKSNMRNRPIGIGVQGLADAFILMDLAFTSPEAAAVNKAIFETMYHAALEQSNDTAFIEGQTYATFPGSPASMGILQFDMWNVIPDSGRYDWEALKTKIRAHGIRNSLFLAPMPTASTSQILGFNECFEPLTSNLYSRRTLAGEFIVVNKYLIKELIELGEWNEQVKNNIILNKGSIQQLTHLSPHLREKYKIVWEIPMKTIINMAADRGAFICQSQSMNLWMSEPSYQKLTSMFFYAWKKGLKTGMYYLRTKAKHQPQQFTIEPPQSGTQLLTIEDDGGAEICDICSS